MKKVLIGLLAMIASIGCYAQGVDFKQYRNWEAVVDAAKSSGKYIIVDAFATWCVPCKEMDAKTFMVKEVGDYLNENFISVKVQMDQTKNDSEYVKFWYADAKEISRENAVNAFPTLLIFSPSSKFAGRIVGFRDPKELVQDIKNAVDQAKIFEPLYSQYKMGKRDSAFVKDLVTKAQGLGNTVLAHAIAQEFVNSLDETELFKPHNLLFAYINTTESKDKSFNIFRQQGAKADAVFGPKFRNPSKILTDKIIYKEEIEPHLSKQDLDWKVIDEAITTKHGGIDREYYNGIRMNYAAGMEKWEEFGKYYALYYTTAFSHSAFHINNMSWSVFEHVKDPKVLAIAVKTMEYNLENFDKENPLSWDTYANLLYKIGRKKEAISAGEKAVKLSKNDPEVVESFKKMKGQ